MDEDWARFIHQIPQGKGAEWLVYFDQVLERGLPFHKRVMSLFVKTRRQSHLGYVLRVLVARPQRGVWRYARSFDLPKVHWGKKAHPVAHAKAVELGIPFVPNVRAGHEAWAPFSSPCPVSAPLSNDFAHQLLGL